MKRLIIKEERIKGFKASPQGIMPEDTRKACFKGSEVPPFVKEDDNPNVLIKGRWLERGGSAFIVSTAGTGKSIMSMQLSLCWAAGVDFCGLVPNKPYRSKGLRVWVFQSEDSMTRIAQDLDDVTTELMESHPDVDWMAQRDKIYFFRHDGKTGADFVSFLDAHLAANKDSDTLPDIIIINPLMAYIGGPITDSTFVTPFLRGGLAGKLITSGLQAVLEKYGVAVLIFHHTPKPPSSDAEVKNWIKSPFPEYQGAGSSDITNWGRSFITMMRVRGKPKMVMLTAGKNGGELGWDEIDGARRRYLCWSKGVGVSGGPRHAWREPTDEELASANVTVTSDQTRADAQTIADALLASPMTRGDIFHNGMAGLSKRRFEKGWSHFVNSYESYGVYALDVMDAPRKVYFGEREEVTRLAREEGVRLRVAVVPHVRKS